MLESLPDIRAIQGKPTREQIVEVADQLFYRQGFDHTSFADIAGLVGISRGNFYHHFKTKDEILDAVIGLRVARTRKMLAAWEAAADGPFDRLKSFIRILIVNRVPIMNHGCPVGSLCAELVKLEHAALDRAGGLFGLFRDWLTDQFRLLGRDADAEELAMHLLVLSQGVATLAASIGDQAFVDREVQRAIDWLESISEEPPVATRRTRSPI